MPSYNIRKRETLNPFYAVNSAYSGRLNGFNVGLELRNGLLRRSEDMLSQFWSFFDWRGWFLRFGNPTTCLRSQYLAVAQINDDYKQSHFRSLRRSFERQDPPKYWPKFVLLDFRRSNGNRAYWVVYYGTLSIRTTFVILILILIIEKPAIFFFHKQSQYLSIGHDLSTKLIILRSEIQSKNSSVWLNLLRNNINRMLKLHFILLYCRIITDYNMFTTHASRFK